MLKSCYEVTASGLDLAEWAFVKTRLGFSSPLTLIPCHFSLRCLPPSKYPNEAKVLVQHDLEIFTIYC